MKHIFKTTNTLVKEIRATGASNRRMSLVLDINRSTIQLLQSYKRKKIVHTSYVKLVVLHDAVVTKGIDIKEISGIQFNKLKDGPSGTYTAEVVRVGDSSST